MMKTQTRKDTLIFTHNLPNHTIGFSYNEESKSPDLRLAGADDDLHFQKIRPIANDLMQLHATHKLGKKAHREKRNHQRRVRHRQPIQ